VESADIQGDILRAHGNQYRWTSYLFAEVHDAAAGCVWLRGLVPQVTNAEPWSGDKPLTTLNIAFSHAGLAALDVPPGALDTFSSEFRAGMRARAPALGDVGPGAPAQWDPSLRAGGLHVLLVVNGRSSQEFDDRIAELEEGIADTRGGVAVAHREDGRLLGGPGEQVREHFGFADGFSQPAIEGIADEARVAGGGVPEKDGRWRPLALGEFVLGYEDEDSRDDPEPKQPVAPYGRNGTYMVWRKLHQDVALFRHTLRDASIQYTGGDEAVLAAKVVGRWPDGTPLVTSPDRPLGGGSAADANRSAAAAKAAANAFRFRDTDAVGMKCPLGAHIRRANPRDALGFEGRLSFRHRMIRRGMPYGEPLPPDVVEDDGEPRGLIFVCFVASISRQFEGVQIQWLNDGNAFRLGHDRDFLIGGNAPGKMTIQGDPPFFLSPQGPFVTTKGGEYLFVPGLRALAAIAQVPATGRRP
jgi:Dyp-type peroxidase family